MYSFNCTNVVRSAQLPIVNKVSIAQLRPDYSGLHKVCCRMCTTSVTSCVLINTNNTCLIAPVHLDISCLPLSMTKRFSLTTEPIADCTLWLGAALYHFHNYMSFHTCGLPTRQHCPSRGKILPAIAFKGWERQMFTHRHSFSDHE